MLRSVRRAALAALLVFRPAFAQPTPVKAVSLHEALVAAREDRAGSPEAAAPFRRLAETHGTPLYVYDRASIVSQARALKAAFSPRFPKLKIFYALKANTNGAIVSILRSEGLGAEVVSGGEFLTARRLGIPPPDIVFTSSSKSPAEIDMAVNAGTVLNVDSLDELGQVQAAGAKAGKKPRVSFRMNPGVDPHTIHQINTGISGSKFGLHIDGGIAFSAYEKAKAMAGVEIVGIHCHIGSQITGTEGYERTAQKMLAFVRELKERLGLRLQWIDLGGGLGVPYHDGEKVMSPEDLARVLDPIWKEGIAALGYEPELWLEPGRFFVAPSGFLLTRVNSVKTTPVKTFVNVDAGFNTLVRPAMYQAYHRVRAVGRSGDAMTVDVAGDVCETGDILAEGRTLPRVESGDLVVILDAGAYGFSMASEYNARPLPAEVLVDGDTGTVIRRRGTWEDLWRSEIPARPGR